MPDYPVVSGAEIVRALERLGFEQIRQRGSHIVLRRGGQGCVVPMHHEVKRGTLAGIVRQAGVTPDESSPPWRKDAHHLQRLPGRIDV